MTLTIFYILLLIFLSGFFSGSETGLTASSKSKIHQKKSEGSSAAEKVVALRERKEDLIGVILLGNNAINIGASALATSLAIALFGQEGVVYATVAMTLLVLIFAEVLPKTYALRHAEKVALFVGPVFYVLVKVFAPITKVVQIIVDFFLRIVGLGAPTEEEVDTSALRGAIEMHHDEGVVIKGDRDMLDGVLDILEIDVRDVMIHRKNMETLDLGLETEELVQSALGSSYTRIPVWEQDSDNIVGILHVKTLMRAYKEHGGALDQEQVKDLLMQPWFVPENTNLRDQLHAFRERRNHFSLIVDEYGDLMGMITLEDILEEIVGQIEDEEDVKKLHVRQLNDGSYLMNGSINIRDLNRENDWDLPDDMDVSTVAGLVINQAMIIPDVNQIFHFFGYRFEVMRKKRNQITMLKVRKLTEDELSEE